MDGQIQPKLSKWTNLGQTARADGCGRTAQSYFGKVRNGTHGSVESVGMVGSGRIGRDGRTHGVVKISGYGVKPGWNGQIGGVQHVHVYTRKWCVERRGEFYPTL